MEGLQSPYWRFLEYPEGQAPAIEVVHAATELTSIRTGQTGVSYSVPVYDASKNYVLKVTSSDGNTKEYQMPAGAYPLTDPIRIPDSQ